MCWFVSLSQRERVKGEGEASLKDGRSNPLTLFARSLRHNQTDAERLLWSRLRNRQVLGLKFRRQLAIPPYIADFCCEEKNLIIELDGGQHAETTERDANRSRFFALRGYKVIRFWNNEVLTNLSGVLEAIVGHLGSTDPEHSTD